MTRFKTITLTLLLSYGVSPIHAQLGGSDLKVFGYFQASLGYRKDLDGPVENKSFSLQQLNLFLQKELAQRWTIFINFELVNSFSSFRNWGAHNLEEAWVSFRRSEQFKLKLGLQIPTFNNLNEIKNRTPLLPYIIRPLAYESSFNEIIALEEFAPAQAVENLLNGMQEGAHRTSEIVRGLRNFTRLEEDERKPADINKGLESTLLMLKHQLKNRVEVINAFGEIPEIMCYPGKLNQAFLNILANASQAIDGPGKIFIKTSYDGEIVTISIKDTGKGMTEEVKKHFFEPFFTTKPVGEGTGLGLPITYGIIQEHDGNIEVYSEPGRGSEFVITLPAKSNVARTAGLESGLQAVGLNLQ